MAAATADATQTELNLMELEMEKEIERELDQFNKDTYEEKVEAARSQSEAPAVKKMTEAAAEPEAEAPPKLDPAEVKNWL